MNIIELIEKKNKVKICSASVSLTETVTNGIYKKNL